MMDAVKTLTIMGAQSHAHTRLVFNRYGVHRISAEGSSNSHGKSVIMKIIYALNGEFLDKESRLAIIRDDSEYCIGSVESFNGYRLSVVIHEEKSKCFYMLEYKGQSVKKSLSDDYKELIKVLNFHKTDEFDYSLNIYKTKTTLPFTHFSGSQNEKILVSASEIPNYRKMLDILDENIKTIESDMALNKTRIASCESNLNMIRYNYTQDDITNFNLYDRFVRDYQMLKELHNPLTDSIKLKEELEELQKRKIVNPTLSIKPLELLSKMSTAQKLIQESVQDLSTLENLRSTIVKYEDLTNGLQFLKDLTVVKTSLGELMTSGLELRGKKPFNPQASTSILSKLNVLKESLEVIKESRKVTEMNTTFKPVTNYSNLNAISSLKNLLIDLVETKATQPKSVAKVLHLNKDILNKLSNLTSATSSLATVESNRPIPVREVNCKTELLTQLDSLTKGITSVTLILGEIEQHKIRGIQLKEELTSLTEELGVCPTCGGELDLERMLEHEHN